MVRRFGHTPTVRCFDREHRLYPITCDPRYICNQTPQSVCAREVGCSWIHTPFVCRRCPERYNQTKNNTEHGQKLVAECELGFRELIHERDDCGRESAQLKDPPRDGRQNTDSLVAIHVKKSNSGHIALMTVALSFVFACPPENIVVFPMADSLHRSR